MDFFSILEGIFLAIGGFYLIAFILHSNKIACFTYYGSTMEIDTFICNNNSDRTLYFFTCQRI